MPCHTTDRCRYKTAYRPRLTTIFLCLLGLALLPSALCRVGAESRHRDATTQEAVPVAIGFHLGQAYATSVAHFSNGTVINLAKVPAGDEYTALMERMVRQPAPQDRPGRLQSLWRLLMRTLRMPPSKDAAVLVRVAAALKAESEAALDGRAIDSAAVTAPWMAAWDGQVASNSIINDVLVLVGIEPVSWEDSHPIYLGETNSLLAANKRRLCVDRWCGVGSGLSEQGAVAFLISFTNQSLHTSFQIARCFYSDSWDNHLSTIDPRYGLDKLKESEPPQDFWDSVRERLLEQVAEHARRHSVHSDLPFLVLVAGEAATEPDFTDVLQEVVKSIPDVRVTSGGEQTGDIRRQQGTERQPEVELIIPDDPTFAAARGAAFWMWVRLEGSYCDEWCAANPGECMSQYDAHDEL
ncbi:hypothetical protein INS49_011476 [Diaporthe citri]|uniref:uncharacterized protein n=1 Tax=Diaporthe citri TaxID=83186 RepID=UPI001C80483E|nr:uncharacterized protein INS49_011476 [Diaporthe citri]KAG6360416.1 hypothetical protein INS49_011476 [Diaporthe citri]